ncbi:MAG: hypothetical protein AVDCRST_MAG50-1519 [uncultured Acidimicrobiales bacterium]|uniref:Uncharacterized protein n=1 Tax=uncultured Acidimicrobiales bacterium TaxID=310071 RepID=A0A6J4I1V7_9ACTN|nr:MAG: hypothetical protein AVDCRST_MAG50-1519 [uncultured Acidimicrobiales bacterium]
MPAGVIVLAQVAAVVVAHDRALELARPGEAARLLRPVVAAMVALAVGAAPLLLGG